MTTEADPTGKDPHQPGAKLDKDKLRAGLCVTAFANAISAVAEVTTYGAKKYTPNGWVSVPDAEERYTDALYRHLLKDAAGERVDPETGLTHLAHACWNLSAVLELRLRKNGAAK